MNRQEEIRNKGFRIPLNSDTSELPSRPSLDFSKVKIGVKSLEDAVITNAGDLKKVNPNLADKQEVLRLSIALNTSWFCKDERNIRFLF